MRAFVYGAKFERGDRRGIVVSFPDVPEAITQGIDELDAISMAEEALGMALLTYAQRGLPLPRPRRHARTVSIAVDADVAAKLALLDAFRASGLTRTELARKIDKDEKEVRRMLDPKHPTKLPALKIALRALGQQLVIGTEAAVAA